MDKFRRFERGTPYWHFLHPLPMHTGALYHARHQETHMTICPIAIAVGCRKCPVFKICPAKSLIGDAPKAEAPKTEAPKARSAKSSKAAAPRKTSKKANK